MTITPTTIATARPEDIFPGNKADAERVYKQLARQWHPDRPTGSHDVFAVLTNLYQSALHKLEHGQWEGRATVTLCEMRGTEFTFDAQANKPFELGRVLISRHAVVTLIDNAHKDLLLNGVAMVGRCKFKDDRMRNECARYLPSNTVTGQLQNGQFMVRTNKTADLIRLRDLIGHTGKLEPKHGAWIVSSLFNLCCYLAYTGIVHHDIGPDTYYVSPEFHSGALLGGWWYAALDGQAISKVTARTADVMPFTVRNRKVADHRTDLELVRATAREIMVDPPALMKKFLDAPAKDPAVIQYHDWLEMLKKLYGPRRFTKMTVTQEDVYGG